MPREPFTQWIKKKSNKLIFVRICLFIFNVLLVLGVIIYAYVKLKGKL